MPGMLGMTEMPEMLGRPCKPGLPVIPEKSCIPGTPAMDRMHGVTNAWSDRNMLSGWNA